MRYVIIRIFSLIRLRALTASDFQFLSHYTRVADHAWYGLGHRFYLLPN